MIIKLIEIKIIQYYFYPEFFYFTEHTVGTLWMWIGDLSLSWHYQQQ
jgi:hypothetical protein